MKRADRRQLELVEPGIVQEKVVHGETVGRRMDADRHVKLGSFFVDRKEVRIAGGPVQLEALLQDATSPVVFRPPNLFHRLVDAQERRATSTGGWHSR